MIKYTIQITNTTPKLHPIRSSRSGFPNKKKFGNSTKYESVRKLGNRNNLLKVKLPYHETNEIESDSEYLMLVFFVILNGCIFKTMLSINHAIKFRSRNGSRV